MKIKVSSIVKVVIGIFVFMHLGILLIPLSGTSMFSTSYITKDRMLLFLIMLLFCVFMGSLYGNKVSRKYIYFELSILTVCCIRGMVGAMNSNSRIIDSLSLIWPYLYPWLALPVLNLLCEEKYKIENLAKFIVISTTIDTLLKAFMSFYQSISETILWSNLVHGEMGYRNGIYRINPSALNILVVPLSFWLISRVDKKREKVVYMIAMVVDVLYAYIVWQARSALLYKTIIIILMIFMYKTNDRKKIIKGFFLLIGIIIFVNLPIFADFVSSFSASDSTYGGSTTARLNAIAYFMGRYVQHPVLGIGCLQTIDRYAIGGGMLEDMGFLYGLVQLGIPMIIFYLVTFARGIYVSVKLKSKSNNDGVLCLALTVLFIMFGINMDTFYAFAIAVPFYLAFVEFLNWKEKYK